MLQRCDMQVSIECTELRTLIEALVVDHCGGLGHKLSNPCQNPQDSDVVTRETNTAGYLQPHRLNPSRYSHNKPLA